MPGVLLRVLGLDPMDWESLRFAARMFVLIGVMALVAFFELRSAHAATKDTGVAWFYSIAIYGIAALTFARGTSVAIRSGFVLGGILVIASIHGAYDIITDLLRPEGYELPDYDTDTWITVAIALASGGMLYRFRGANNPVQRATWMLAVVDVITSLEDVGAVALINWAGSPTLGLASDCFDVSTTLIGAILVIRESQRGMIANQRAIPET